MIENIDKLWELLTSPQKETQNSADEMSRALGDTVYESLSMWLIQHKKHNVLWSMMHQSIQLRLRAVTLMTRLTKAFRDDFCSWLCSSSPKDIRTFSKIPIRDMQQFFKDNETPLDRGAYPPRSLQFSGLYIRAVKDMECLRFYPNGIALSVTVSTSGGDDVIPNIVRWFDFYRSDSIYGLKEHNCYGIWSFHNDQLVFYTTSGSGTVIYSGLLKEDTMQLSTFSLINGYRAYPKTYFFHDLSS